ncbi:abasic site processing protein HMCES [Neoarius graeffei]|uniref:abasic site processing protein HMCES n=1 Tax=Neoarius graeffei TaxID=443677 RepID=UPI00298C61E3|nr:abasic site processing protein HMCES [Neoarius graeffei]XP_060766562.1 abasic site processing protein HMCES [Neoarius graeffei]
MCGRTACTLAPDEVRRASRYRDRSGQQRWPQWRDGDADKYRPSYNKSPQSFSPVLLSNRHFNQGAAVDDCVLATMRWGLVPAWFKENDPSKMQYSTSNCRSESLLEKKSYKDPLLKGQRCVILADGFYEWRRQQKGKQPFFIYFPQSQADQQDKEERKLKSDEPCEGDAEEGSEWAGWRLLTMAGLFDCWTPPGGGEVLYTYTVITVNASPNLQSIHDRMPAILEGEEEVRRWLDFGEVRSLEALKLLQSKSCLTFHPVSSFVNNSRNNSPECLQPLDPAAKKAPPQASASSKMMMSWLQSGSPSKRTAADDAEPQEMEEKPLSGQQKSKAVGPLQQWLLGSEARKRPKTESS